MCIKRIELVLLFGLLSAIASMAQNHYIRLSPSVGFATDFATDKSVGGAAEFGGGYRMDWNHLAADVGVGVQYLNFHNRMPDMHSDPPAFDEQNVPYVGHALWSQRNNVSNRIHINIPVMLGGQWEKIYFLVGAKVNLHVWGNLAEEGLYTYTGEYERYLEPLKDMPQHGFVTDEPYSKNNQSIDFGYDVRVAAEVAYSIYGEANARYNKPSYFVGLFAEYSVLHPSDFYPLVVGAKVTMLWPIKKRKQCMCYE